MSLFAGEKERRVIPRWRDFRATAATGELDGVPIAPRTLDDGGFFAEKVSAWAAAKSIEAAAELVAAATVLGREADARDAAHFLLEAGSAATSAVRALARALLFRGRHGEPREQEADQAVPVQADVLRLRVRALRQQLSETPRNGLLWVDLSRTYATLGQNRPAVRAMDRALTLLPANRFVLRAASRLFVHVDEPDEADAILRDKAVTRQDPWLLAAQIAVSSVAGRSSPLVKTARRILESERHPPLHLAELAGAVATLNLTDGDLRSARRLFRQSLSDPTENAVAQAAWAARQMGGVEVTADVLARTRRSFEAQAFTRFYEGQWRAAMSQAEQWLLDEPYSSRPALLGSYVASIASEDYGLAESFASRGLMANPDEPILHNNLVYAIANQGRLEEAQRIFDAIPEVEDDTTRTVLLATAGLLSFRRGQPQEGRLRYLQAIERALQPEVRALAALNLAREEIVAGTREAEEALRRAEAYSVGVQRSDIRWLLEILRARVGRKVSESTRS
jgi:tetratricopeptide (TPR) repeat protein